MPSKKTVKGKAMNVSSDVIDLASDLDPWERQPDETPAAFKAFSRFLDIGPGRSVVESYRQHRSKPNVKHASGTFNVWQRRYRWDERARAYDRFLRREAARLLMQEAMTEHLRDMRAEMFLFADRLAAASDIALSKVTAGLTKLDVEGAKVSEVAALLRATRDCIELSTNARAQALGLHHLTGMLTGEQAVPLAASPELRPSAQA